MVAVRTKAGSSGRRHQMDSFIVLSLLLFCFERSILSFFFRCVCLLIHTPQPPLIETKDERRAWIDEWCWLSGGEENTEKND